jgi:hypothetical protein
LSGCDFFAEVEVRRAEGEGGVIPIKICRPKVTEMQDPPSHGDRSAGIRRFSVGSKNAFEKMNTTLLTALRPVHSEGLAGVWNHASIPNFTL